MILSLSEKMTHFGPPPKFRPPTASFPNLSKIAKLFTQSTDFSHFWNTARRRFMDDRAPKRIGQFLFLKSTRMNQSRKNRFFVAFRGLQRPTKTLANFCWVPDKQWDVRRRMAFFIFYSLFFIKKNRPDKKGLTRNEEK